MKSMIVVALALVAVAAAAPVEDAQAQILEEAFDREPEGGYIFRYKTDNGLTRVEKGTLVELLDEEKKPHNVVVVRGSYSFINPEGEPETIMYEADESGYRAVGPSVPKVERR